MRRTTYWRIYYFTTQYSAKRTGDSNVAKKANKLNLVINWTHKRCSWTAFHDNDISHNIFSHDTYVVRVRCGNLISCKSQASSKNLKFVLFISLLNFSEEKQCNLIFGYWLYEISFTTVELISNTTLTIELNFT